MQPDRSQPASNVASRRVTVRATWTSQHTIDVPADTPQPVDIDTLLDIEDIESNTAELTDWEITDDA